MKVKYANVKVSESIHKQAKVVSAQEGITLTNFYDLAASKLIAMAPQSYFPKKKKTK